MGKHHHIIYIPGLADNGIRKISQELLIYIWQAMYGVTTESLSVGWAAAHDTFEAKRDRLLRCIDAADAKGWTVSLVAASAGASLAINAFAQRRAALNRVAVIAGALGPVEDASPHILAHNPALKSSLEHLPAAVRALTASDRTRILSVKPHQDRVVPLRDMDIEGINYLHLSTKHHAHTIATALTTRSHTIITFIKRTA